MKAKNIFCASRGLIHTTHLYALPLVACNCAVITLAGQGVLLFPTALVSNFNILGTVGSSQESIIGLLCHYGPALVNTLAQFLIQFLIANLSFPIIPFPLCLVIGMDWKAVSAA